MGLSTGRIRWSSAEFAPVLPLYRAESNPTEKTCLAWLLYLLKTSHGRHAFELLPRDERLPMLKQRVRQSPLPWRVRLLSTPSKRRMVSISTDQWFGRVIAPESLQHCPPPSNRMIPSKAQV